MAIDAVYSNVNLKAKKKSKSAFGGDDDSDDIDYTLIDFTNSGNKQRRPNAVDSEAVTYSAVKIPQPGVSKEPIHRDGAEGDDVIYYKITQPHRDGLSSQSSAQHNEPLPTQSGHTPAAFLAQSDPFPMTMMLRETQQRFFQRPTFLLFLCVLFFTLTVILGVLYLLEENAHAEALESLKVLNISHGKLSGEKVSLLRQIDELDEEKTSIQNQLNAVNKSWQFEMDTNRKLSLEKKTREWNLTSVTRDLEKEKQQNKQLTSDKETKEKKLSDLRTEKENAERLRDQYNTSLSDTQKRLDEQKISNAFLSHIKDSIEVELKKYRETFHKTRDDEQKKMLNSVLQALEMGCALGWKNLESGKCYFFSSESDTWYQSRDACQAKGGHLVVIDSEGEWELLMKKRPGVTKTSYWIGLTDAEEEATWCWVDNTVLGESYRHWMNKEPDNWTDKKKKPEGEDCARTNDMEGSWMDAFCDKKYHYICEATAAVKP
ncbi:C-type lectin domain family 4 member M-like isoform X1 [Alosa alosa]|uniref:C-type lectin domain family 4 member M-like isoform X1 n=1 Tax=Alosa alosa TaxID=278164 RepID=UPI0020152B3E|nr:C-type lectin domain family 4 member M-like isoform X1 [Alosa alosa]